MKSFQEALQCGCLSVCHLLHFFLSTVASYICEFCIIMNPLEMLEDIWRNNSCESALDYEDIMHIYQTLFEW